MVQTTVYFKPEVITGMCICIVICVNLRYRYRGIGHVETMFVPYSQANHQDLGSRFFTGGRTTFLSPNQQIQALCATE